VHIVHLVVIWKASIAFFDIDEFVLPPPNEVWAAFIELAAAPDTWLVHARTTLVETLAGFLFGLVFGVFVGAVLGRVVWLEHALRPLLVTLQVTPKVALIPLFVIAFGFGLTSKVVTAAILAFFPIMLNVMLGVRSVEAGHHEVMRSLYANRWQTFRYLEFPSTLPYVFAGMEVGIVFAVIGATVGEFLGGNEGLGYLVVASMNQLNQPRVFAVVVLFAGLGSVLLFAVNVAKRLAIPWHDSVAQKTP
jgi:NitT/TauT family transport system permease protein